MEFGSQLPHCVVVRLGTRLLSSEYPGAYVVVVVGAGLEVAVLTVSVCVKLNSWKECEGIAVAYELLREHCGSDVGPSAGM